ncbi:protein RTM1 [Colletotrichum spaethianum]|uniref:Protein RTM1 n=1 Tax=Colletotrichum spaethianum TaxID=700344 RepID=A0AA37PHD4_9PEZI|nr:protein RTM1 [Colletotrichum spaethianum]GKT52213.1 protein RTM1 [Colletotrichum spaethianum]
MPDLETHNGKLLWYYIPSLPGGVIFAVAFGLLTILHTVAMLRHRMWFCLPFVLGGISYNATDDLILYIMQSVLLLLAPILFAATLYMTLSRVIIAVHGQESSIISTRWLTRFFVFSDCFSFLVQAGGSGFLVKPSRAHIGQVIVVTGLMFQIVMFGVFIVSILGFHLRFARHVDNHRVRHVPWQSTLTMLYLTSIAVMLRNVYRVVEYVLGRESYLSVNEWPTYIFDALLMLFTMAAFYWWYPSKVCQKEHYRDSESELMCRSRRAAAKKGLYSNIPSSTQLEGVHYT